MPSHAQRLRRIQYAANLDIDRVMDPLAAEAERLIMRHSEDGKVTRRTKRRVLEALDVLLARAEPEIAAGIVAKAREAEKLAEGAFE
jgi:hypothetical protein